VISGGAVSKNHKYWKRVKGKYLFYQASLAKVFRARFLASIREEGLALPQTVPAAWVVDCAHVGQGGGLFSSICLDISTGELSARKISSQTKMGSLLSDM